MHRAERKQAVKGEEGTKFFLWESFSIDVLQSNKTQVQQSILCLCPFMKIVFEIEAVPLEDTIWRWILSWNVRGQKKLLAPNWEEERLFSPPFS